MIHFLRKAKDIKRQILFYRYIFAHPQTPQVSKVLLGCAIGYMVLPFDIIPDFIPILGQLDDAVIVPFLFFLAMRTVPQGIVSEAKQKLHIQ